MCCDIGSVLLNRFVILSRLGGGSYGNVFRARDISDDTDVAVKISEGSHEIKQRNVDEARILKHLSSILSPYRQLVINMKTCIVLDNHVILVLELMPQSLYQAVEKNSQNTTYSTIVKYATQMFDFLCFMSQMNIIHADIKPHNILIDENGCLKFADFGLAYCPNLSKKSSYIQSLYYRSPEILLGYDYDASVDVWSMGCVLMQCLLRKALFCVKDEMELMRHIALAVGTPAQHIIHGAPNRSVYFDYNRSLNLWIPKGSILPIMPLGLKRYLIMYHNRNIDCGREVALLNLVERMLRPEPYDRITPEECLGHSFIKEGNFNRMSETVFVEQKKKANESEIGKTATIPVEVVTSTRKLDRHQQFSASDNRDKMRESVNPIATHKVKASASGVGKTTANPVEIVSSIRSLDRYHQQIPVPDMHDKIEKSLDLIADFDHMATEKDKKNDIASRCGSSTIYEVIEIPDDHMSKRVGQETAVEVEKEKEERKEEKMDVNETISKKKRKAVKKKNDACKDELNIPDCMAIYRSKLDLPASVIARAEEIYVRVVESKIFGRSLPRTVVPVCIYAAIREAGIKKSSKDVSEILGTNQCTIRQRLVMMKRHSGVLDK